MPNLTHKIVPLLVPFFLAGCAHYEFRNANGTLPDAKFFYMCSDESAKLFPPYYVQEYHPGYIAAAEKTCSKDGVCTEKEGIWVEGAISRIDKNRDDREDLFISCMMAEGHVWTKIKNEYHLKDFIPCFSLRCSVMQDWEN